METAFKVVPARPNEKENRETVMKKIIEEFKIQRDCSQTPRDGDRHLMQQYIQRYIRWQDHYDPGSENLIVSPLAFFILENPTNNQSWGPGPTT